MTCHRSQECLFSPPSLGNTFTSLSDSSRTWHVTDTSLDHMKHDIAIFKITPLIPWERWLDREERDCALFIFTALLPISVTERWPKDSEDASWKRQSIWTSQEWATWEQTCHHLSRYHSKDIPSYECILYYWGKEIQYYLYVTVITCKTFNTLYWCVHIQGKVGKREKEVKKPSFLRAKNGSEIRAGCILASVLAIFYLLSYKENVYAMKVWKK